MTHDGAIALIDNGKLIFSIEMEKLDNNKRHAAFNLTLEKINALLGEYGYSLDETDRLVIDGWGNELNPASETSKNYSLDVSLRGTDKLTIGLAPYGHLVAGEDLLKGSAFHYDVDGFALRYNSYPHAAGHILGAYCTSPFAGRNEDSFVLVWDGGMPPQLFYYRCQENKVESLGPLFLLMGFIYINFPHALEPFSRLPKDLSIAGKAMAYIALGNVQSELLQVYRQTFAAVLNEAKDLKLTPELCVIVTQEFIKNATTPAIRSQYTSDDMLTTFHVFLEELLVESIGRKVKDYPGYQRNLCFAGGCALNIKWNSALRESKLFEGVWVPPFPNDAGSAIGTACCEMVNQGTRSLAWNVYSGPALRVSGMDQGWQAAECSVEELARMLHEAGEPVVVLNGRAELGPRALGNRSILAPATDFGMKQLLNTIKVREHYRPVAPICLEQDAPAIFDPGSPDPFMLYDHLVRPDWLAKIPAVCHLDQTARLQTVNAADNPVIYELLTRYKALSGIPLLCNTSANFKGKGFFPDAESAMRWGMVNYVWSEGILFTKAEKVQMTEAGHLQSEKI